MKDISIKEASELLQVSDKTVRRRIKAKEIKAKKVKGVYKIDQSSLGLDTMKKESSNIGSGVSDGYIQIPKKTLESLENQLADKKKELQESKDKNALLEGYKQIPKEVLESLQNQLETKDKQISDLRDLMQNEQVLNREIQQRIPMLSAPQDDSSSNEGNIKKGLFSRLFNK